MKKKRLGVLISLLAIAGAGVYTYARYTTSYTGTGKAEVAKWSVSLKQGNSEVSENFDLTLTPTENTNVVGDKIAPGRSATAQLVLDLTGTEVATQYEIDFSQVTGLPDGMTISDVKATVGQDEVQLTKDGSKYSGVLELENDTAISETITFDVTVTWEDKTENNANDTSAGETSGELSIPVKVTASQFIG